MRQVAQQRVQIGEHVLVKELEIEVHNPKPAPAGMRDRAGEQRALPHLARALHDGRAAAPDDMRLDDGIAIALDVDAGRGRKGTRGDVEHYAGRTSSPRWPGCGNGLADRRHDA